MNYIYFFALDTQWCDVAALKRLSLEKDLAFDDMHGHWPVLSLNRGRGQFLNLLGALMIL